MSAQSERARKFMKLCSKPSGWLGRFNVWRMNSHHSALTNWGLSHILGTQAGADVPRFEVALDIGCGGGATIYKLAAMAPQGQVYGVDFAEASVAASKRKNAKWIESGRVEIREASVSQLPFADGMFDLVTAVETHFFWPNLADDMREVFRVVRPGGTFILIAEVYRGGKKLVGQIAERYVEITGMTLLTVEEHRELLRNAGFCDVKVVEEWDKGWICGWGRR
jgi:SAM-dependent methyltransferase